PAVADRRRGPRSARGRQAEPVRSVPGLDDELLNLLTTGDVLTEPYLIERPRPGQPNLDRAGGRLAWGRPGGRHVVVGQQLDELPVARGRLGIVRLAFQQIRRVRGADGGAERPQDRHVVL